MRIRVRDHVNPFSPRFATPPEPLNFAEIFANPIQPLHLDLGCALGGFVLQMARNFPHVNFLGLDIREPMIERAKRLAFGAELTNLHYQFCNATISLKNLFAHLPGGVLHTVTIQFPDPHLKKRLAKRRMVQASLIEDLAQHCAANAKVFVQTDVEAAAAEICGLFEQHEKFQRSHAPLWLSENPFSVKTEREVVVEHQNLRIFRRMFEKKAR